MILHRLPAVALALALTLVAPSASRAQHGTAPSALDSYERARTLVDAAVAAHGGLPALRAARHARVAYEGFDYHRLQSRRVDPPLDSTVRRHDLTLDLDRGRLVMEQTRGYPGGFYYTTRYVSDSARHWSVDVRNGTYSEQRYPPADQQAGNLFYFPQHYLLPVATSPARGQWRALGRMRLASGAEVDAVAVPMHNAQFTLGFDPQTHRLRSVMSVGWDVFTGDGAVETEFLDYQDVNGLLLPMRTVIHRAGERVAELRPVSAALGVAIPDSLLAPPADFTVVAAPTSPQPVRELAPGVWAVHASGSWSLVVAFADHLLVVDAPTRSAPDVIARAATLAPGKPIRYVVPTHHHDDHFGGIRHFAAAGATIVTTPGNRAYVDRLLQAPAPTVAAALPVASSAPVELVSGKRRRFTDGTRVVEVHDVGPNAHAEEMLVAWLPGEGILFQGDLIEAPRGVAQRGANAEATLQLADYVRRQGRRVRTFGGTHGFLDGPAEFEALVRHPVVGPAPLRP